MAIRFSDFVPHPQQYHITLCLVCVMLSTCTSSSTLTKHLEKYNIDRQG